MKIPIHNKEDMERLNEEYMAHEENRYFDLRLSVRNRTMTRKSYFDFQRGLRKFLWHMKQNRFVAGAYF